MSYLQANDMKTVQLKVGPVGFIVAAFLLTAVAHAADYTIKLDRVEKAGDAYSFSCQGKFDTDQTVASTGAAPKKQHQGHMAELTGTGKPQIMNIFVKLSASGVERG